MSITILHHKRGGYITEGEKKNHQSFSVRVLCAFILIALLSMRECFSLTGEETPFKINSRPSRRRS